MRMHYLILALVVLSLAEADALEVRPSQINWSQSLPEGANVLGAPTGNPAVTVRTNGMTVIAMDHMNNIIASGTAGIGGDDYDVLQAAFDFLDTSHFTIDLYGDIFYLDQDLRLPAKVDLDGHGATLQVDWSNATSHDSMIRDDSASAEKWRSWKIRNLELDGADKATINYGINVSRVKYCNFENVYAGNFAKDGFMIRDDSWGNVFLNCYTNNNAENGLHFVAGANDAPNSCSILAGRYYADDDACIFIEAGQDIRIIGAEIASSVRGILTYADSTIIDDCYLEALTTGIDLGAAGYQVRTPSITNNNFYTVADCIAFTNARAGYTTISGNMKDGVPIDTKRGSATGSGSEQTVSLAGLEGMPISFSCWYTENGALDWPRAYYDRWWGTLNITATNARSYAYAVEMGY